MSQLSRLYRISAGIKKSIPSIFNVTSFTRECAKNHFLMNPSKLGIGRKLLMKGRSLLGRIGALA
jgi:hypothetical protein